MREYGEDQSIDQDPPPPVDGRRRRKMRMKMREIAETQTQIPEDPSISMGEESVEQIADRAPAHEVEERTPAPSPAPSGRVMRGGSDGRIIQEMRSNEERAIKDWLDELSGSGAIRVSVLRQLPTTWKGKNIEGLLATYTTAIDEDFIRDTHGGGQFYLRVMRPRKSGTGFEYAGGKVIKIAGDPRMDDVYREEKEERHAPQPNSDIIRTVVGTLERQLEKAQESSGRGNGANFDAMRAATAPLQAQLDQLNRERRELQSQLFAAQNQRPPQDEYKDRLFEKMLDADNARVAGIRTQHESEIRQLKTSFMDTEARIRDAFERDKQSINMAHDREIAALKSAYDIKTGALENAFATQRALMEAELRRLDSALTETKSELAALRAKKEKSLLEQINDVNAIKEAIGLDDDEKEDKSMLDKVLETGAPLLQSMISRGAEGGVQGMPNMQPMMQPNPAAMAQPRQPRERLLRGPEGLYTQAPNGQIKLVRRAPNAAAPGVQQKAEPGKSLSKKVPEIAPATAKIAIDYLETSYRNSQPPELVAQSVKTLVPSDVLTAIRVLGVDGFLDDVAKIDGASPLSTQGGRNWARKLAKVLLGT